MGLYISSLSSCLGGLYGAPRILQCIANENVIPFMAVLGHGVSLAGKDFMIITVVLLSYNLPHWLAAPVFRKIAQYSREILAFLTSSEKLKCTLNRQISQKKWAP